MATRGERGRGEPRHGDQASRPAGPPPPKESRTWRSIADARTGQQRSVPRKGSKAQAKRQRARVAQRASAVAAQRRAALRRHHAVREAELRGEQPTVPAAAPPTTPPARRPLEELLPDSAGRSRRAWVVAGVVAAGVLVAAGAGLGVVSLVAPDGSGSAEDTGATAADQAPPPAAPESGDLVRSAVGVDGRLVTTHWIVRDEPIDELSVQLQPTTDFGPVVERFAVEADGRAVDYGADGLTDARTDTIAFDEGARTIRLRYVTRSTVEEAGPSNPGRALVLVNPVQVTDGQTEPVVVQFAGEDVLSLACVGGNADGGAIPTPCGRPAAAGWRVQLDDLDSVHVTAQVDLPVDRTT